MLPVLILCASFISPVLLEEVVNKNVTLNSTPEVEKEIPISPSPVNVQTRRAENSVKSKPDVSRPLRMNSNIGSENISTSGCPQTDILLKILKLLTNLLPSNVVEPQKFKNGVSDINLLLGKAPVIPAYIGLHNTFKILQDELEKILNESKGHTKSYEPNENKLRTKIPLKYNVPNKCEEVLNTIIDFLNNAYREFLNSCLVRGKCLVNNLPQIQYGISEQGKLPPLLDQLIENLIKPQYESQSSNGPNKPVHSLTSPYSKFLMDKSFENTEVNNIPWQYIYSASNIPMKNSNIDQNSPNVLSEELRSSVPENFPSNSERNINNEIPYLSKLNIVAQPADNPLKAGNEMLTSNILVNPYYKPTDFVTPDIQNLLTLTGTNNQPFQNPFLNNVYYPSTSNGINDLLLKYLQERQILAHKLAEAYPNMNIDVRPDNLYVTPDKNKQQAQLTNLIQQGVSNSVKLNEVTNRNGVVELTYMLKQPKPAIEPLYYAKYKMPYNAFLYNMQDILNKKPYLRQFPKQLYQELLMKSNITDVSDELKNLHQDELTKLVSTNGTLVAAKVIQDNKDIAENLSNVLQTLNSTPLPKDNQLSLTAARLLNLPLYNSPKPLIDTQKRLGLNPGNSYFPYSIQSQYQPNLNYNSGNKILNPNYSTFYGVPLMKYAYLLKKI